MSRLDELVALRDKLDTAIARERKSLWTVAYLRDEVNDLLDQRATEVTAVLAAAAHSFGVTVADIVGRSRQQPVVNARHVAGWLLYDRGISLPQVGGILHRDHSTIHHGNRRVAADERLGAVAAIIRSSIASASQQAAS